MSHPKQKKNNLQREAFAIVMEDGKITPFALKFGGTDIMFAGIFIKREQAEEWLKYVENYLKPAYKNSRFGIVKVNVNYVPPKSKKE